MSKINFFTLLQEQKNNKCRNNLYYISQLEFAYNSSKIAGILLSDTDVRLMYDENIIVSDGKAYNLKDIFEVYNHFQAFDYILDNINMSLSQDFIKNLYKILKRNTQEEINFSNTFGDFRKQNLEYVNFDITSPKNIEKEIYEMIYKYERNESRTLEDILEFHYKFECIHPFADANGRIGRLIMFKECLRNNVAPFIIIDASKLDYYRGLKAYKENNKYLVNYAQKLQKIYEDVSVKFDNQYEF